MDLEGAEYMILGDEEYDRKSIELEERCFKVIALQAPVATDLRAVVSAIKIIADIERSADLCVNICKAARRIYGHELDPQLRGVIQKMGDQAKVLFKEATEAYLNLDGMRAAALHDMDAYLDDLHRQFIQVIFESHAAGNIDLQVAVQLAVVARFYERIGDHAVNVGERTRYIVNGWLPEHPYARERQRPADARARRRIRQRLTPWSSSLRSPPSSGSVIGMAVDVARSATRGAGRREPLAAPAPLRADDRADVASLADRGGRPPRGRRGRRVEIGSVQVPQRRPPGDSTGTHVGVLIDDHVAATSPRPGVATGAPDRRIARAAEAAGSTISADPIPTAGASRSSRT